MNIVSTTPGFASRTALMPAYNEHDIEQVNCDLVTLEM